MSNVRGAQLKQAVSQEARKYFVTICLNEEIDFTNLAILPENADCIDSEEAKALESDSSLQLIRNQVISEEVNNFKKVTIVHAHYGVGGRITNATKAVTDLYNSGTRKFYSNNSLVGDPASGKQKFLRIEWKLQGKTHSQDAVEGSSTPIELP